MFDDSVVYGDEQHRSNSLYLPKLNSLQSRTKQCNLIFTEILTLTTIYSMTKIKMTIFH